ncbi:MAG TPA: hypothetical protein VEH27_04860 [Methylomirabilota bacterium]|nr:hypothetical protein [Methylomirabilota bacterium]
MKRSKSQKSDYQRGREQQEAENRGAKIPFYAKAVGRELLKPSGTSGKR